jgi:hypothetical protein
MAFVICLPAFPLAGQTFHRGEVVSTTTSYACGPPGFFELAGIYAPDLSSLRLVDLHGSGYHGYSPVSLRYQSDSATIVALAPTFTDSDAFFTDVVSIGPDGAVTSILSPLPTAIARYDACEEIARSTIPLPPFIDAHELRVQPDGGLLVADSGRRATVVRLDADGRLARTYAFPGLENEDVNGIALNPEGRSFYATFGRAHCADELRPERGRHDRHRPNGAPTSAIPRRRAAARRVETRRMRGDLVQRHQFHSVSGRRVSARRSASRKRHQRWRRRPCRRCPR